MTTTAHARHLSKVPPVLGGFRGAAPIHPTTNHPLSRQRVMIRLPRRVLYVRGVSRTATAGTTPAPREAARKAAILNPTAGALHERDPSPAPHPVQPVPSFAPKRRRRRS